MNSSQSPIADPATTAAEAPFNDAEADIILRSSDNVEFRVLKLFLSRASSFFRNMFDLPQGAASGDQEMRDKIPVIAMAESASVVKHVLQCCYPLAAVGGITFESVVEIYKLLEAAQKYDMAGVDAIARCAIGPMSGLMINYPFEVYALAAEYKWEEEVRVAARKCLHNGPPWSYPSSQIMESVSGAILRRLDRYFTRCTDAAKSTVHAVEWPRIYGALCDCPHCKQTGSTRVGIDTYNINRPIRSPGSTQRVYLNHNGWPNNHWAVYLREIGDFLGQRPRGSTALDPNLMNKAIIGSVGCESCLNKLSGVISMMRDMATHLEAEIDKAVDNVKLEVRL
ncbi:hypothetical protein FIBSPDRAFT_343476 [Athelia psychrophila]|uniref:BTB domain-containing protein n=1 Tax=Athelia psychrophila TaxID=1759441 RepID=A0A167W6B8_9AGAM|nr:hypothetical protein FIBSPDRAFT_343476 [Fibularhizoctonia sp. CBS 109695]